MFYVVAAAMAVTLNFFLPRFMPGDPVDVMFASFQGRLDPRALESLKAAFGFVEGPLHEQFITYLGHLAQGDLGLSVTSFPVPVSRVIGTSLGWTLRLIGIAAITSFAIGTFLGIIAAWRRGGVIDSAVLPVTSILGAFPYFWVAMLAVYVLGLRLKVFPLGMAADNSLHKDWGSWTYVSSVVEHAILPLAVIIITSLGGWLLGMRNNMIGVLSQDYIVMAQAKGLSDRRVMFNYAARNAILPSITGFAMSLGFVIGGALLTEVVFSYPGIGKMLLSAVNGRDYPLMQGIFLMITLSVLVANFLADIVYVLLDPRVR
jgi:peptide/nickel transport system permease protein